MAAPSVALSEPGARASGLARDERLAAMAADNFQFIWRSLRRLGVVPPLVDDAAQQVFEVVARRLGEIELGRERAFLFKTAVFVAAEARRTAAKRRAHDGGDVLDELFDGRPNPEEATDWARKRALLDVPRGTVASRLRRAREEFQAEAKRVRARLEFRGGAR